MEGGWSAAAGEMHTPNLILVPEVSIKLVLEIERKLGNTGGQVLL